MGSPGITTSSLPPATAPQTSGPQEGIISSKYRVKIGQGVIVIGAVLLVVGLALACVGGQIYDSTAAFKESYPNNRLFQLAWAMRNEGIGLAVTGLVVLALGTYIYRRASGKGEGDKKVKREPAHVEDGKAAGVTQGQSDLTKTKRNLLFYAAIAFTILFLIGLTLASTGGKLYDAATYNHDVDGGMYQLAWDVRNAGITATVFGLLGALACFYKAHQYNQQLLSAAGTDPALPEKS